MALTLVAVGLLLRCNGGCSDAAFISKGYDPTTHFETTVEDVLDLYKRITGKELDLSKASGACVGLLARRLFQGLGKAARISSEED